MIYIRSQISSLFPILLSNLPGDFQNFEDNCCVVISFVSLQYWHMTWR